MITKEEFMDIISLYRQGYSLRAIAKKLGMHRETVKKHIESDSFPKYDTKEKRGSKLEAYYPVIESFLKEDNYQATWIYDKLTTLGYEGCYDLVKRYVSKIKEQRSRIAYVRFETEPGRQAQVDWGYFHVEESNGGTTTYFGFLMTLGYSRAMYVEFTKKSTLEALMDCHAHAFRELGGVPIELLYDNMKSVIIDRKGGDIHFNVEFLNFARHYGFLPKVCPPYSPWVKGKVERPITYVRERFWRGYSFNNLLQSNNDVKLWLAGTANERTHGTHHQKVKDRWEVEKPYLQCMPEKDYDTSEKAFRKVYKDCQVSYHGNQYVVPHHVVGKNIMLKVKNGTIRFYNDEELLVTYQEPQEKGKLVQDPRFYEQLMQDRQMCQRKYGKGKAKSNTSFDEEVFVRPLSEYEALVEGEQAWNS